MPPRWLRPSNPFILFPVLFVVGNAILNIFPEPPAIQEVKARRWAEAKRQREEEHQRAMESQIEEYERKNPGVFDRKWAEEDRDRE